MSTSQNQKAFKHSGIYIHNKLHHGFLLVPAYIMHSLTSYIYEVYEILAGPCSCQPEKFQYKPNALVFTFLEESKSSMPKICLM